MTALEGLHPTEETLRAYGLGGLDEASARSVRDHLESCPDCRGRMAQRSRSHAFGELRSNGARSQKPGPLMSSTEGLPEWSAEAGGTPARAGTMPKGFADHPDYAIIRELGRGGMGVVYLADNRLMGRKEVLKVVGSHLVGRPGAPDRFLTEIRNAARLHHPNIVTAYSALRFGDSLVLAMEYVDGLDLARIVRAYGPLPIANACRYMQQAALGMQHAHEHGMVHRDIKPGNLMLTGQGGAALVKILDFGLAKVRSEGVSDGGLTDAGQMLGTPAYVAPEQISDARRADIRADIYSLGCTLYDLLTGEPPFRGDCIYDILQAHQSMEAMPLNRRRPDVPVELAALVAKMMAKEPERRFRESRDVARALTPFFKKGEPARHSPGVDGSLMGRPGPGGEVPDVVSAPGRPGADGPPPDSDPRWEVLVDRGEAERLRDATSAMAPARRASGFGPAAAVGGLLLALIVVGAVFFRGETPRETIRSGTLPKAERLLRSPTAAAEVREAPRVAAESAVTGPAVPRETPPDAFGAQDADRAGSLEMPTETVVSPSPAGAAAARLARAPEPPPAPSASPALRLFDGSSLKGWVFDKSDDRMWRVENRTLVAENPDHRGFGAFGRGRLLTTRTFKEFRFRFEYQAGPGFDFGAVWWTLPGENPPIFRPEGSILGLGVNRGGHRLSARGKRVQLKGGDGWNLVEIEARDRSIRISVNGIETNRRDLPEKPKQPTVLKNALPAGRYPRVGVDRRSGRVGFEISAGAGRFRNIVIEEVPPSPVSKEPAPPEIEVEEEAVD